jgi:hypothetical protein
VAVCFASSASALAAGSTARVGCEGLRAVDRAAVFAAAALRSSREGFCVAPRPEVPAWGGFLEEPVLRVAMGVPWNWGGEVWGSNR